MTQFFTSDTHFNHARIIELSDRPFYSVEEHDMAIVHNWNMMVTEFDRVYHLGDVALGPWPVGLNRVKALRGTKYLVPGNHDRISSVEKVARRERFMPDYKEVFDFIMPEQTMISIQGIEFRLCHYPPAEIPDHEGQDRFSRLRPWDDGTNILHGHTHQSHKAVRLTSGAWAINVGVDAWDYKPVHEDQILSLCGY